MRLEKSRVTPLIKDCLCHIKLLKKGRCFKNGISSAKYKCLSKNKSSVKTILMLIIVEQYLQTHVVDSRLIFHVKLVPLKL